MVYLITERTASYKEYMELRGSMIAHIQKYPDLASKKISIDTFLDTSEEINNRAKSLAYVLSSDYEKYYWFLENQFDSRYIAVHEGRHAQVAERYGLQVCFGLIHALEIDPFEPYNEKIGFVATNLCEVARRLASEEGTDAAIKLMLDYAVETGTIRTAGRMDKFSVHMAKIAQQIAENQTLPTPL